jgi:hypothetical protein
MTVQIARLAIVAAALVAAAGAQAEEFAVRLGRMPVDSRTQASVTGLGRAVADLDGAVLRIDGEFAGLQGPATIASLRLGKATGARGPVIEALDVTHGKDGRVSGSIRLDADQLEALHAGRLYIQIDSESAPEGNLWGWLLR